MIALLKGDITQQRCDAIVNAANPALLGGGGVDGAIHRAAGPALKAHCAALPVVRDGMRCPPGHAVLTPAFGLPAHHVIHTVGPVYLRDPDPPATLRAAHVNSLALAAASGLRTVCLPAISCGVYGYPLDAAARIAIDSARIFEDQLERIAFVLFGPETLAAWERALAAG